MHDLRLLAAFAQAARSGSFTVAAQILHCSPGAVSKNIARLEQEVGIRLFNRTTRRLSLTEEGSEFFYAVQRSLDELQRADDIVAAARDHVEGVVRLAVGGTFGKTHVLPALARLMERHRALNLEIAFSDDPGDLISRGYDLAVRCGAPQDSRIICRRLISLPLKLVASPGYVERTGLPSHPYDLFRRDCINVRHRDANCAWIFVPSTGAGTAAVRIDPPARVMILDHAEALVATALGGFGPTVIDAFTAHPHLDAGTLVELLPGWRVEASIEGGGDVYLVYPHRDYLPLRIRAVIDFLIDEFGSGGGRRIGPAEGYDKAAGLLS